MPPAVTWRVAGIWARGVRGLEARESGYEGVRISGVQDIRGLGVRGQEGGGPVGTAEAVVAAVQVLLAEEQRRGGEEATLSQVMEDPIKFLKG